MPSNVLVVRLTILSCATQLDIVLQDRKALGNCVVDGLVQPMVHRVMNAECKHQKGCSGLKHLRESGAIRVKLLGEVGLARRASDRTLEEVKPRAHELLLCLTWFVWVQGCHRVDGHPTQRTPYGRHLLFTRKSSPDNSCAQAAFVDLIHQRIWGLRTHRVPRHCKRRPLLLRRHARSLCSCR